MIGDETVNGKPVFDVGFLDLCKIVTRTERRTKFSLDSQNLMEHIVKNRYSKKFVVRYDGMLIDAESASKGNSENSPET
jgi:hypothetical protein